MSKFQWFVHPGFALPMEGGIWPSGSAETEIDAKKAAMDTYMNLIRTKGATNLRITFLSPPL